VNTRLPVWRSREGMWSSLRLATLTVRTRIVEHERWVTLFAAMLVFTTFIVKDVWQDESKDLVDQIESANTAFSLKLSNQEQLSAIKTIQSSLNSKNLPANSGLGSSCEDSVYETLPKINDVLEFLNKIPDKSDSVKALDFSDRVGKLFTKCAAYSDEEKKQSDSIPANQVQRGMWKGIQLRMEATSLAIEVSTLQIQVQSNALDIAEKSKHSYVICKRFSYALYALAWGLALIGKLSGISALGGSS